jgi:hypothetical protein
VKAELVVRSERSLDGDRTPTTIAADVTRRRIVGVTVDDDTDRLCGRTVSVGDPIAVESEDDDDGTTGTDVGGDGGVTPPLPSPATPDAGTTTTSFV